MVSALNPKFIPKQDFFFSKKFIKSVKKTKMFRTSIRIFFFLKDGQIYIMKRKTVLLAPKYLQPMHNQLHDLLRKLIHFISAVFKKAFTPF